MAFRCSPLVCMVQFILLPSSKWLTLVYQFACRNNFKLASLCETQTCRYFHGNQPEADKQGFLPEGSGGVRALGLDRNIDPSLIPSYGAHLQSDSCQPHMLQDFDLMSNSAIARQRQQHCFFGSDVGSLGALKQESHAIRPFWEDGGPKDRASWADLDDHGYEKNAFATTQLSISARSSYSPNGESTLKLRSTNTETWHNTGSGTREFPTE